MPSELMARLQCAGSDPGIKANQAVYTGVSQEHSGNNIDHLLVSFFVVPNLTVKIKG
jgi:hypothetical protein